MPGGTHRHGRGPAGTTLSLKTRFRQGGVSYPWGDGGARRRLPGRGNGREEPSMGWAVFQAMEARPSGAWPRRSNAKKATHNVADQIRLAWYGEYAFYRAICNALSHNYRTHGRRGGSWAVW